MIKYLKYEIDTKYIKYINYEKYLNNGKKVLY